MSKQETRVMSFRVNDAEHAAIQTTGTAIRRATGANVSTSDVIRAATQLGIADFGKLMAAVAGVE